MNNIRTIPCTLEDVRKLQPGDFYYAQQNGPGRVLTVRVNDAENGWIIPEEQAYVYGWMRVHMLDPTYTKEELKALIKSTTEEYNAWVSSALFSAPWLRKT